MENKTDNDTTTDTGQSSAVGDAVVSTPAASEKASVNVASTNTSSTSKPAKQKSSGGIFTVLTFLLVVIALGACFYIWQLLGQQQQQFESGKSDIATAINMTAEQDEINVRLRRQLESQTDEASRQHRELASQIAALQQQLSSQQKKLASLSTTDRDDWLLAEAEYLIRLANQRLLMGKEVAGALDLLSAADDIAKELDDSALYPVRQALANDMAALRSAAKLDIEGIYLQLGALAKQVDQLRLFEMPELQIKSAEMAAPATWQERLDSGLQSAWNRLSSYIQINKRDDVYEPLLAPEYEAAVRQNVRLMFEQAQMAVLSNKQRLYQDSLSKAKDWLNNYYRIDAASTEEQLRQIDELAKLQISVPLPDISGSLRALKSFVDVSRPMVVSEPSQQEEAAQ